MSSNPSNLLTIIKKLWHDPVGSILAAALITAAALKARPLFALEVTLPLWMICAGYLFEGLVIWGLGLRKKRQSNTLNFERIVRLLDERDRMVDRKR